MSFVQHTSDEIEQMLKTIGVSSIDDLFTDIPKNLRLKDGLKNVPAGLGEADLLRDVRAMGAKNTPTSSRVTFLGAGMERHFIPHIVDHISLDGNFITAYTPYQPEVSQGTLSSIFQFQTMLSSITGLPVTNASLYDGSTAVAEGMLVAHRVAQKKYKKETRNRVIVPRSLHAEHRRTIETYAASSGMVLSEVGYDATTGHMVAADFDKALAQGDVACALLAWPNMFGTVEDMRPWVQKLHAAGALAVAVVHPLALSLFATPGEVGCDVAVGEGQPIGCYQALGGPAFGFFSCSEDMIRFAPGRIVSQTVDRDGKRAFCLALKTREQDIRREKATSNICTNQALMALRAVVYLASLGKVGYVELGEQIASATRYAAQAFDKAGVKRRFAKGVSFNELVVEGPADLAQRAAKAGMQNGLELSRFFAELKGCYLITLNETHTREEIDRYVALFR